MADPQEHLKRWLDERLEKLGPASKTRLARHLNISTDVVRRMLSLDPSKERRTIPAHLLAEIADFVGEMPPGFPQPSRAGEGMEKDLSNLARDAIGDTNSVDAPTEVTIGDVSGPVTLVDRSVHIAGRDNSATLGTDIASELGGQILGRILEAAIEEFRAAGKDWEARQLGEIAFEHLLSAVTTVQEPSEVEPMMEIIRQRITKTVRPG